MAEITSASGVQASTMYQYFSNKDDVVWAIAGEVLGSGVEMARQTIEGASNAFARITHLFEFMADQLSTRLRDVRFMAQFDAMYAQNWPTERLLALESQIYPEGLRYFSRLVQEGIVDGSLRPDLDPDLTMHAVINSVVGAQRRLASFGPKVELEYGQPIDRLFRESIRVILLGLRAADTPATTELSERAGARKIAAKRRTP